MKRLPTSREIYEDENGRWWVPKIFKVDLGTFALGLQSGQFKFHNGKVLAALNPDRELK